MFELILVDPKKELCDLWEKAFADFSEVKVIHGYFEEAAEFDCMVGTSFIMETLNEKYPYVAHTPTMRVPRSINGTENVYLATKAMLEAVARFNKLNQDSIIRKVLCPGLGTSTGRMPLRESARQMKLAYQNYRFPPNSLDWEFAMKRHNQVQDNGRIGYNFDPMEK